MIHVETEPFQSEAILFNIRLTPETIEPVLIQKKMRKFELNPRHLN